MDNIREMRKIKGIYQKDIAEKLNKSITCISDWERGRTEPNIDDLKELANLFNCSIDYLVGREDESGTIFIMGNELSKSENKLLDMVRQLHDDDKDAIYKIIESILLSYKFKK